MDFVHSFTQELEFGHNRSHSLPVFSNPCLSEGHHWWVALMPRRSGTPKKIQRFCSGSNHGRRKHKKKLRVAKSKSVRLEIWAVTSDTKGNVTFSCNLFQVRGHTFPTSDNNCWPEKNVHNTVATATTTIALLSKSTGRDRSVASQMLLLKKKQNKNKQTPGSKKRRTTLRRVMNKKSDWWIVSSLAYSACIILGLSAVRQKCDWPTKAHWTCVHSITPRYLFVCEQ